MIDDLILVIASLVLLSVAIISAKLLIRKVKNEAKFRQFHVNPPDCPNCGEQMPRFRDPESLRQEAFGGWTCSNCRTELDRFGTDISGLEVGERFRPKKILERFQKPIDEKGKSPVERSFGED